MKSLLNHIILAFCFTGTALFGQVNFTASVSKNKVAIGERFTIEFSVNQKGKNFKAPDFNGFRVLSGPNSSMSSFIDNNGARYTFSYSYILSPRSEGSINIGPAFINVDGKTYKTQTLKISVTEKPIASKNPNSPENKAKESVFIKASVSRSSIYQGEPIFAKYELYFKNQIGQPQLVSEPDFNGFYKEEIEHDRIHTETKVVNGQRFTVGNIREMVLIPQKSGNLKMDYVVMDVPTQIPSGRYDFFGRPLGKQIDLEIRDQFPPLKVKPLPLSKRPDDFSGAVGDFNFKVSVNTTELTTDESLSIKLELNGTGNIKLASLPEIEFPQAFEAYDPEYKESTRVGSFGMKGSKSAEYLLVPRYNGTYKIGPISFSYFNPKTERYKTIKSEVFEITVTGGQVAPAEMQSGSTISNTEKEKVNFIGNDILFIKTKAYKWKDRNKHFYGSRLFYLLLITIILATTGLILFYIIRNSGNKDRSMLRQQQAAKLAKKHLALAKKELDQSNTEAFYQALATALWGYFSDKLKIPQSKMNKDFLAEELNAHNIDESLKNGVFEMMNRAEMARYTSVGGTNPQGDYEETARVLTEIEKAI